MTPISKVLSLLLTVLVVTSLFVPAVAATADDGKWSITPEEALEFRVECGYLTQFAGDRGYQYKDDGVWDIYTGIDGKREIIADNDEKRMGLLEFMWFVDYLSGHDPSAVSMWFVNYLSGHDPFTEGALSIHMPLVMCIGMHMPLVMFITINQCLMPILSDDSWHHGDDYMV